MQNPEVWKFPAPSSNYKERTGNFLIDQANIPKEINDFYFNHLVSVVLPDTVNIPQRIQESLTKDCEYYRVDKLKVSELVEKKFIESFVKTGKLTLLSIGTRIDTDDCVCITPEGVLVLALNKKVYEELGIQGHVSHFTPKSKDRYNIETVP